MKWVALLHLKQLQETAERSLYYSMTCFYCGLFLFIAVAIKQHPKWRSEVHLRLSLHSALKRSLLIKELTEEDEVDAICDSEQVLSENTCWSREASGWLLWIWGDQTPRPRSQGD